MKGTIEIQCCACDINKSKCSSILFKRISFLVKAYLKIQLKSIHHNTPLKRKSMPIYQMKWRGNYNARGASHGALLASRPHAPLFTPRPCITTTRSPNKPVSANSQRIGLLFLCPRLRGQSRPLRLRHR